jgi:4-hydroxybenzoate polyprenyltransferase
LRRGRGILAAIGHDLTESVRAGEWWEYKLAPIFAVFYATALTLGVPVSTLWLQAVTLLLSLVPGAAYVSVINDVTDRADDAAAGKPNRIAGRPRPVVVALVALPIAAGLAFAFLWRGDGLLLSLYLAAWAAFSLYSLPPFRFKTRGILGVLCDAGGAHLFPTLVAVVLACRGANRAVDLRWLAAAGVWAFANGIRGILWHQLSDVENDRSAGVHTFAERHSPRLLVRLGTFVVFPLELAALAALLWRVPSAWPAVALAAYVAVEGVRAYAFRLNPVIVKPKPRFRIVLHEYYELYLPVGILLASALRYPFDWLALAAHLLLFNGRLRLTLSDVAQMWREWKRYHG